MQRQREREKEVILGLIERISRAWPLCQTLCFHPWNTTIQTVDPGHVYGWSDACSPSRSYWAVQWKKIPSHMQKIIGCVIRCCTIFIILKLYSCFYVIFNFLNFKFELAVAFLSLINLKPNHPIIKYIYIFVFKKKKNIDGHQLCS